MDFIIVHDDANQNFDLASENINFTGRFAVVRKYKNNQDLDSLIGMYIGEGASLTVYGNELAPSSGTSAYAEVTNFPVALAEITIPLSVSPNPSSTGVFYLSDKQAYQVFDLKGRLVKTGNGKEIDLSSEMGSRFVLRTDLGEKILIKI